MLRPDGALASQHEGDEPARAWPLAASGAELAIGVEEAVAVEMVRDRPPIIDIVQKARQRRRQPEQQREQGDQCAADSGAPALRLFRRGGRQTASASRIFRIFSFQTSGAFW